MTMIDHDDLHASISRLHEEAEDLAAQAKALVARGVDPRTGKVAALRKEATRKMRVAAQLRAQAEVPA